MLTSDEQWIRTVDAFGNAALDGEGWYQALEMLAEATGSDHGQLIGLGAEAAIPFNLWTIDPDVVREFDELGYGDPARNPRVRAGSAIPELTVLADHDFITPEETKTNEHYKWSRHAGLSYICLSPLIYTGSMLIGLAVSRSERTGHVSKKEKQLFASFAPHVRAAVRTQMLLEGHTAAILTGAMEAMSIAAFTCDITGKITALTPSAEALVSGDCYLSLKNEFLDAELAEDNQALTAAIQAAATGLTRPGAPLMKSLFIRSARAPLDPIIADVISLPSKAFTFGFGPRVLVVVRGMEKESTQLAAALQTAFSLTATEAQIALQLANGKTPEAVANQRGVSVGTIRSQMKSIYSKLGVRTQVELTARLRPLQ